MPHKFGINSPPSVKHISQKAFFKHALEYRKLNWAPFAFGIVLVGLEAGWIYAYKAGWQVSTASVMQSAFLAIALIFVGWMLYHEALTWNKLVGVAICLLGLAFINHK